MPRSRDRRPARWLAALATAVAPLLCLFPASVEPAEPCALPAGDLDTEALMQRCAACAQAGRLLDAGKLWYATSVRLRALAALDSQPDRFPALMGSLQETLGQPINEWLGGDVRDWLVALDWAIAWDARTRFAELSTVGPMLGPRATPDALRQAHREQRDGLRRLRDKIAAMDPAEVYRSRLDNGVAVRDSRFDAARRRMR